MIVEDIYRITNLTQDVEIYNPKTAEYVYIGECSNIPLSCLDILDIPVSQIFTNDNILTIMVR